MNFFFTYFFSIIFMINFFLQAYHGHLQALQVLLESFIDIDIKDADGKSSSMSTQINYLAQITAAHGKKRVL